MRHSKVYVRSDDLEEASVRVCLTNEQISEVLIKLGANYAKPQGNNIQADHCFLHNNSDPTLGVSQDPPHSWNCFNPSCKKGKSILSLIAIARGTTKKQALSWLYTIFPEMEQVGLGSYTRIRDFLSRNQEPAQRFVLPNTALKAYSLSADDSIGYRAIDYWGKCSREQADAFRLGYDRKNHRIIFPVFHSDGCLAGLIGRSMLRSTPKEFRWFNYDEGLFKKSLCLMGAELPLEDGPIVVVEGPSDYINLRAGGVRNVRALMGSSPSETQVGIIISYDLPVVPLLDADKAGRIGRVKLMKMIEHRVPIWGFRYPSPAFDDRGEADPGGIPKDSMEELISSFSMASRYRRPRAY